MSVARSQVPNAQLSLSALFSGFDLPEPLANAIPKDITMDSREVAGGSIFVALKGSNIDRREFCGAALDAGALAVIVDGEENAWRYIDSTQSAIEISLLDLPKRIGELAHRFFGRPSEKTTLVGITGTNGKTSCVDYLRQLWTHMGKRAASIGTLGWKIGDQPYQSTGMTTMNVIDNHRTLALLLDQGVTHVAMEVSSHGIHQRRIAGLDFDVRALTNITRDHLDYHASFEDYRNTKLEFIDVYNDKPRHKAVVNLDDECSREFLASHQYKQVLRFSLIDATADVYLENIVATGTGYRANLKIDAEAHQIDIPLIGAFNLQNASLVIASLIASNESPATFLPNLAHIQAAPGRLQRINNVFVDYAHTPDALKSVLVALAPHCSGRLIVLFGCGGDRDVGKRAQMAKVAEAYAQLVIVTSDNPRTEAPLQIIEHILSGFTHPESVQVEPDRAKAIVAAIGCAQKQDIVLVAGKGHENYQEINGRRYPFSDVEEVMRAVA